MAQAAQQAILGFYTYPPVGGDDWRYTFQTAQVRVLEMQLLTKAALLDMANAESFEAAADLLTGTEYALPQGSKSITDLENTLRLRRTAVRELFGNFILDEPIIKLFRARDDFANLRLALRRMLTEKPIGTDYSDEGNLGADMLEQVFEQENYDLLPDYIQQAADQAVVAYYQNKDIRQIDYAIDSAQAQYNLRKARRLESIFLLGLFRIQIDLTNIRTMLRLKFTEAEQRNVFLLGGYIEHERLLHALDLGYEAIGPLFYATPYYQIAEAGANYLAPNNSFLKLEWHCQQHLTEFLKSTVQITAGPQPIIAYLLMKENEIRTIRLILTAKKNALDTRLILDRLGE